MSWRRGVLHAHTTYSDGELTLAELQDRYRQRGCEFVAVTDHAEAFDEASLRAYVSECRSLSASGCVLLPGLEFECDGRMHILGYGVERRTDSTKPEEVIAHIRREQGVAVIAHPADASFAQIEGFETLPDGIEVWNSKYDGRAAPRPRTFRLLERLQTRQPRVRAFFGQDLHWRTQFSGLFVDIEVERLDPPSLLDALRRGAFRAVKGSLRLPSGGELSRSQAVRFGVANAISAVVWRSLKYGRKLTRRAGIPVPDSMKEQLRRVR